MTYGKHVSARNTPQSRPLPGRESEMVKNAAGGFVFSITPMQRLHRFLILGNEGGTYYASEAKMTRENAANAVALLESEPRAVIDLAVEISHGGLAPKNEPAIFVLALGSVAQARETRRMAFDAMPKVCRIPTHLFTFVQYHEELGGGWGRAMRTAISRWYTGQSAMQLAINAIKYPSRNGWSHRDLMRLAHPRPSDELGKLVLDAICEPEAGKHRLAPSNKDDGAIRIRGQSQGWAPLASHVKQVAGWLALRGEKMTPKAAAEVIREHNLQREMIPTELLTSKEVWDALLPNLGLTALLRNLGNLSKCELLVPMSAAAKDVRARLTDPEALRKARVHPFSVLLALKTYAAGHGFRGSGTWSPVSTVVDALNDAFYAAFHNVAPTGKRFILGIDVSGSMSGVINNSNITAAEAAAAMAMVTARVEKDYEIVGFDHGLRDLKITARDSLADVCRKTGINNGGGTDCALPVLACLERKLKVDAVLVYTDNETWRGLEHAQSALVRYRKEMEIPMKLGFVAFDATGTSVADPKDPGSMNFVGLDASLPQAINAFIQA